MNKETAQKIKEMLEEIKNEPNIKIRQGKATQMMAFLEGYITNVLSS